MKTLGVIPARAGSKGVIGKNIKLLNGKPLINFTIEAALASSLTKVIVSTDGEDIAQISRDAGVDVPFMRPPHLATDEAKSISVVLHALEEVEAATSSQYDAVMLLQPTTPFRTKDDIDQAIQRFEQTKADSIISVVDVGAHHPARMKYLEGDRLIDPAFCEEYENQPRQELNPMYIRSGAIYLTRREVLLQNSFKGKDCRALIMPLERSVNIDTEIDFRYAQWVLNEVLS